MLAAQRRALDELREHARTAVRELAHDDRYEELLERLRTLAASQLGPDAEISVDAGW